MVRIQDFLKSERQDNVSALADDKALETFREHSCDGDFLSVDVERPAEHISIAARVFLPVCVTEQSLVTVWAPVGLVVCLAKNAAEERPQFEHAKPVTRYEGAFNVRNGTVLLNG
jgi:hypothetical protein